MKIATNLQDGVGALVASSPPTEAATVTADASRRFMPEFGDIDIFGTIPKGVDRFSWGHRQIDLHRMACSIGITGPGRMTDRVVHDRVDAV